MVVLGCCTDDTAGLAQSCRPSVMVVLSFPHRTSHYEFKTTPDDMFTGTSHRNPDAKYARFTGNGCHSPTFLTARHRGLPLPILILIPTQISFMCTSSVFYVFPCCQSTVYTLCHTHNNSRQENRFHQL